MWLVIIAFTLGAFVGAQANSKIQDRPAPTITR